MLPFSKNKPRKSRKSLIWRIGRLLFYTRVSHREILSRAINSSLSSVMVVFLDRRCTLHLQFLLSCNYRISPRRISRLLTVYLHNCALIAARLTTLFSLAVNISNNDAPTGSRCCNRHSFISFVFVHLGFARARCAFQRSQ